MLAIGSSATTTQLSPAAFAARGRELAVIDQDRPVTYGELADRVNRRVRDLGAPGQLLALFAQNSLESLTWYLAALANRNPILLLSDSDRGPAAEILARYEPELVARGAVLRRLTALGQSGGKPPREVHPDLALLLTTSGSTGSPKLVRLSHENLIANALAIATTLQIRPSDRAITTLPMAYSYGLSVINSHLASGACLVLSQYSVVDDCFWDLVTKTQVTCFAGVPHTYDLLEQIGFAEKSIPSLRYLTQAGGRMPPDQVRSLAELGQKQGWDLHVMYGQTEATARMTHLPPDLALTHADSVGYVLPGGAVSLNPTNSELVYSGPNVMMGYATQSSDLALGRTQSCLETGDVAEVDADGLVRIVGRLARFAKVCGLRVDLDRFETELQQALPGNTECAAVASNAGILLAVADDARDASAVRRACAVATKERFGLPATAVTVIQVGELPRGANGKVLRTELAQTDPSADLTDPDGTNPDSLLDFYRHALGRPDATKADTFVGLGGDSLSYVAVASGLGRRMGNTPRDWPHRTVAELQSQIIAEHQRHKSPRRWWQTLEAPVVLRALAILAVVGSHIGTYDIRGGAHLLIALAGFSFARLILVAQHDRITRARCLLGSITRIAVPSLAWLALLVLFSSEYGPTVLMVNSWAGATESTPEWRYWFIEAIVVTLLLAWLLMRSRWFDRAERKHPLLLPLVIAMATWAFALATRGPLDQPAALYSPTAIIWLFALGWAATRCQGRTDRLLVSATLLIGAAGFFGISGRFLVVGIGFLVLLWIDSMPLPRFLTPLVSAIAAASLIIYLTHYQIYPMLGEQLWFALGVAILVGIGLHLGSLRIGQMYREVRSRAATAPNARPSRRRPVARKRRADGPNPPSLRTANVPEQSGYNGALAR
ncbi:MAG: AMP-binding protein [Actinomycetia bacterium]|nr:AMP-binding protein [Actinomycetes bacterium]